MRVQAIGLFARAKCAPECWLPRPFNQKLLILHVGGGAIKQRVKFKKNKFQNKKKKVQKEKEKEKINFSHIDTLPFHNHIQDSQKMLR